MFSRREKRIKFAASSRRKPKSRFGQSEFNRRLLVEPLESRLLLSADSLAWAMAPDLTISFAPDGTDVAGHGSSLFAEFQTPQTANWQQTVVRAFETWTQYTTTNMAAVPDSGDPLGTPGPVAGDTRFGDVRVAAIPLASDVIAMSVPRSEISSGTWAGDILFNSNYDFTSVDELFAVAVHEAGHVLGLGHSDNPNSPMHIHGISDRVTPLAEDITLLRKAFGISGSMEYGSDKYGSDEYRSDEYGEGEAREDEERDAKQEYRQRTEYEDYDLTGPANTYEQEHARTDASRYASNPRYIGSAGYEEYETKVARSSQTTEHDPNALQIVYPDAARPLLYEASGFLASGQQTDVFRLAPSETSDETLKFLTVTVRSDQPGGLIPQVAVYSHDGQIMESEVLANAGGTLVLQVANVTPEDTYLVQVSAANVEAVYQSGGYKLEAQYVKQRAVLDEFFAETLQGGSSATQNTLHVEETTLAQFVLTVDSVGLDSSIAMWTTVYDTAGNVINRITAPAGETRSSGTLLLAPGDYRVEFQAASSDGQAVPNVPFKLRGKTISLPIGPIVSDPTRTPIVPIRNSTPSQGRWSSPDLAVIDPVILPPPASIYRPSPPVIVNPPWYGSGWWYWQNSSLAGNNNNQPW